MSTMKPIVLKAKPRSSECVGLVQLSSDAERVVRRLNYQTGIPIRQIVSEIIIQAEGLIEVRGGSDSTAGDAES